MNKNSDTIVWQRYLLNVLTVSGILILSCDRATAQITLDNTLGNETSIVNTRDATSDKIDGGAIRGQNLFHSFQEFNVDAGRGVYFANPDAVTDIFSRVTGNDVSNILGTLGVDGAANLFLINPNGIIFGEGASLDVQGSFAATTANGIEFGNNGTFDTTNPQTPQLLTIAPSAYLFNQITKTASIQSRSLVTAGESPLGINAFSLSVPDGQNLFLLGGDIVLDSSRLNAFGGRVELGGLKESGEVKVNAEGSLIFPENVARSDVSLINESRINVKGDRGSIKIEAGNINLSYFSVLAAEIESSSGMLDEQAGDIILNATDSIVLDTSRITNLVSGDIDIQADSLVLQNPVLQNLFFDELPNDLRNTVRSKIEAQTKSTGKAGDINIDVRQLTLREGSTISTSAFPEATGKGGNLTVKASESVELIGNAAFESPPTSLLSQSGGMGNGGNIIVETNELIVRDGAGISTQTFDEGEGGDLKIVSPSVKLIGTSILPSGLFSLTSGKFTNDRAGNAGNIEIISDRLTVQDGASIDASTSSEGKAGDIEIKASDDVTITGSSLLGKPSNISTDVFKVDNNISTGKAGNLNIATERLIVRDRGQIRAVTSSIGNSGTIKVTATELSIDNAGSISTNSSGTGNAGNISLKIFDNLAADNSNINTSSERSAGGQIEIDAENIRLQGDSDIRTNVNSGINDGGNINLTADSIIAFDDSDIFAFAEDGQGGNITLDTPAFFAENFTLNSLSSDPDSLENNDRADVNATGAVSGLVTIPDVSFIQNSLTELPDNAIDTDELVANSCVAPVGNRQQGQFIITGKDSLPVRPGNGSISDFSTGKVRSVSDNNSGWQRGEPIVEPQGVYRLTNGKLVLSRPCQSK